MKVVVTGGAGFIGSHLVDALIARGDQVTVVDNLRTGFRKNLNTKARFVFRSVTHCASSDFRGVERIYHLAAVSRILDSFEDPISTYQTNVVGTARIVEVALENGAKLIYAGSSTAETKAGEVIADSPYAHSKHAGEEIVRLFSNRGLEACTCRFFNVYGPRGDTGRSVDSVINVFARQRAAGQPLVVHGNGSQRRDFIHVSDVVKGLLAAGDRGSSGSVYRLGSGENYSISEVAELFGCKPNHQPSRPGERRETLADGVCEEIGWKATISLKNYIANLPIS